MKLENCKVGMIVKVKSLEKCKELGYDDDFNSDLCGKKVIIDGECNKWSGYNFDGLDCVEVAYNKLTQTIPIMLLKKIKQTD